MPIKHRKVSLKSNSNDTAIIQPTDWNDDHTVDQAGVIFGPNMGAGISSVGAGQNYLRTLRRKFNASINEEYEFVDPTELNCRDYDFPAQAPAIALTANVGNVVPLSPVPLGINGINREHYILIVDPSAGNEVVKIQGGTATSGSASGNILITPTKAHAIGYTIKSATFGIQEATNLLSVDGGRIVIPRGRWSIYATITLFKDCTEIYGYNGSFLHAQSTLTNCMFMVDGLDRISGSIKLANFQIVGTGSTSDGLYAIICKRQNSFKVTDISINHFHNGIKISDFDCFRHLYSNVGISYLGVNGFGYNILAGADFYITDGVINAANDGSAIGIRIQANGGTWIHNVDTMNCFHGLKICPDGVGDFNNAGWIWVSDCAFDTGQSHGILMQPTNGATIVGAFFDNSWSASSVGGHGVVLDSSGGIIRSVNFSGNRIINNAKSGFHIDGAEIKYLSLIDNFILENNNENGGVGGNVGIGVYNGPSYVDISHNQVIAYDVDALGGYGKQNRKHGIGIQVETGVCEGLSVVGNIVRGIKTAYFVNNSTSPIQNWSNNIPTGSMLTRLTDTAIVNLLKFDNNSYFVEGNVPITTINGGWYGRVIYIRFIHATPGGFAGGGNVVFNAATPPVIKQYDTATLMFTGQNEWSLIK